MNANSRSVRAESFHGDEIGAFRKPHFMSRRFLMFVTTGLLVSGGWLHDYAASEPAEPLWQEAYVWQRDWNGPVQKAVAQHASSFRELVVLKAEVTWHSRRPHFVHVPLDWATLKAAKTSVGLALRIGPYPGPFRTNDTAADYLTTLAAAMVSEAKSKAVNLCELQIDFDCAESKLDGYRIWVEAIRRRIDPVPLTITALPSWLKHAAFGRLVRATDGYVLQVHSLKRPTDITAPFTLCDPVAAQRAVERAGKFGVPFFVALPTYGYVIAFNQQGAFAGLAAEGPGRTWPKGVRLREVRTDPVAMAKLVRTWSARRPAALRGIIWYRFPVADDSLNLRWPTLAAMMQGRSPREHVCAKARRVEPGLVEISLVNDGELDISSRLAIEVRWSPKGGARLVASDGLRGFDLVDEGSSAVRFQTSNQSFRLPAGTTQTVGWLRLSEDREVQVEIKKP